MATPTSVTFNGASGSHISRGRAVSGLNLSGRYVLFGDSLTALSYPSAGYRVGFAESLYPPHVIQNAGKPNDTLQNMLDRWTADVLPYAPNVIVFRGGTNGAGTGTYQQRFADLFALAKGIGAFMFVHAIPPKGAGTAGVDSGYKAQNAWIEAQCAADPSWLKFVRDSDALGDSNYNCIPAYYIEGVTGIHMNGKGVFAQGVAMAPIYASMLPNVSPLITSASDIYPANSASNQWVQNPFNAGTAGTLYYAGGVVPTGWNVNCSGLSVGGATSSIVAADAGDVNQTSWHKIDLHHGVGNGATTMSTVLSNPAIAADLNTFKGIDMVAEVKLVNLDLTNLTSISMTAAVGGVAVNNALVVNCTAQAGIVINKLWRLRHSLWRSGTLAAYSANSITLTIGVNFSSAFTSSIGAIYIRCVSARGTNS